MNSPELQVAELKPAGGQERKAAASNILFIDNGHRDRRRERSAVLKNAGFKVHPARSFEQSLSRVGSGAYDLIIASTDAAPDQARQFIEELRRTHPRQKLLVLKTTEIELPSEAEVVNSDPKQLLERVQAMLRPADKQSSEPIAA